jgi:hypothetical protein
MAKMIISDDSLDDVDSFDVEEIDELGFISSQKNTRRNVRKSIEDMLEARELQRSIKDIFDDED